MDSLSESSINEDLEGETTEEAADVTMEEEDHGVIYTHITPYEGEPLAEVAEEDDDRIEEHEEVDVDGLSLIVLEVRYKKQVPVNSLSYACYSSFIIEISIEEIFPQRMPVLLKCIFSIQVSLVVVDTLIAIEFSK